MEQDPVLIIMDIIFRMEIEALRSRMKRSQPA